MSILTPFSGIRNALLFAKRGRLPYSGVMEHYPDGKSKAEWRARLPAEVYRVCIEKGTEPPFSGTLPDAETYACACCGAALFRRDEKYDSGSGWPSFTAPAKEGAVAFAEDVSHGMRRVEAVCANCGAHLGHVFPDGPKPAGMRYCVNAAALTEAEGE
jgi:peptide-methionine (R)-S-oxide reductase